MFSNNDRQNEDSEATLKGWGFEVHGGINHIDAIIPTEIVGAIDSVFDDSDTS
jgi:hypothetical protein